MGETFTIDQDPNHAMNFLDWINDDVVEVTLRTISRNPFDFPDIVPVPNNSIIIEPPIARIGPDGTIISRVPF